jgi:flagellar hook assembly protein FlgD
VYSSHLPAAPFSVAEHAGTGALHLWPNPATAELNVELPMADRACTVDIVDAAGRSTQRTTVGRGTARWTWDLRSANGRRVAPGTYTVIVTAGDRGSSGRVVVQ